MPIKHNPPEMGIRTAEEERQSHVDGYERELLGVQQRLAELEDAGQGNTPAANELRERIENATRELKQLGGHKGAQRRPAGKGKQAR